MIKEIIDFCKIQNFSKTRSSRKKKIFERSLLSSKGLRKYFFWQRNLKFFRDFIIGLFFIFIINIPLSYAVDGGMLGNNVADKLRNGNVGLSDIPNAIQSAINFFIGLAGGIAVIFIIIGAYKILFGSIEQDKTKGKDTVLMSIGGFIIASLAWFIVKFIFDNFG